MNLDIRQDERAVAARPTQTQIQTPNPDERVAPDDLDRPVVAQNPLPADGADDDNLGPALHDRRDP